MLFKLRDEAPKSTIQLPKPVTMSENKSIKINEVCFVSPPNVLQVGDVAHYFYGNGIHAKVQIIGINNDTANELQAYQVHLTDGSSMQMTHQELYLSKSALPSDSKMSEGPSLDGRQLLIKQAHPKFSAASVIRWDHTNLECLKLTGIQKSLSYVKFSGDSPFAVLNFVESFQSIVQVNHSKGGVIIPDAKEMMTPTSTFYEMMVAPKDAYQKHHATLTCYHAIARSLRVHLNNSATIASAPGIQ